MRDPARPRLSAITSSLSFKLFFVLFLSILLLFTVYAGVRTRFQARQLEQQVKAEAYRASDFIRQSLLASMLGNERERIYQMITQLGAESGVEVVRIYNKRGEIKFSSDEREIGTSVNLRAEACYACHASDRPLQSLPTAERARIYRKQLDGRHYRVLGLINPIQNSPGCSNGGCHAHTADQSVLGVLDVQMSLATLDSALASSERHGFALATLVILAAALLMAAIVFYAVYVPVKQLRRGTEALAGGNLDVEISLRRSDEMGVLARSFNQMARNLQRADSELRTWSHTLETRVHEKTAELERIHQQIIQVEKTASLGRMAATVAHELNNPLSGIITYAKVVARRLRGAVPESPERAAMLEDLELIRGESMRCGKIVRDLLTYARESTPEFQPVRLHDVIQRALKLVEHHTEIAHVETETELRLADDTVVCDREQIVQALIALMINAVEAMPTGGRLTLKTWEGAPRRACLSVSDTGVGISEEVQERIFDPFFSTKSDAKGVGLGLAVVYGIVQRHEGRISVASAPGAGTTFTIDIPRDPSAAVRGGAPARLAGGRAT
ncbi:MAG: HAMP domain-containing protein [Gemmatimonadetes bacterium]|nr:HAMP domain-containing protein [Gemmatimonadota bacterium]